MNTAAAAERRVLRFAACFVTAAARLPTALQAACSCCCA
jgi:hypothetical protein